MGLQNCGLIVSLRLTKIGAFYFIRLTDHDLQTVDHHLLQILTCRYYMLWRFCIVHIQLRKHVPGHHTDCAAPTQQHGLDHTDQGSSVCPECCECRERSVDHEAGTDASARCANDSIVHRHRFSVLTKLQQNGIVQVTT